MFFGCQLVCVCANTYREISGSKCQDRLLCLEPVIRPADTDLELVPILLTLCLASRCRNRNDNRIRRFGKQSYQFVSKWMPNRRAETMTIHDNTRMFLSKYLSRMK